MRIEFMSLAGAVVHEIGAESVIRYSRSGKKLMSNDFFLNEPANVEVDLICDDWLLSVWESGIVKIADSLWLSYPVRVYHPSAITGYEELILSGIVALNESEHDITGHSMKIKIYDHTALLKDMDLPVRFYYPYSAEGTAFTHFIINYRLPGTEENTAPEGDDNPYDDPPWYPYQNSVTTTDRQISSVLSALTGIVAEAYAGVFPIEFHHEYAEEAASGVSVSNNIVRLDNSDDFYRVFVLGLVVSAYNQMLQLTNSSYYSFWANYGFVSRANRTAIYQEYGILPEDDCDGYFVMRAGYEWQVGGKEDAVPPNGGWTDGEGTPGGNDYLYTWYKEWYRIFAVKSGVCVQDTGQRFRTKQGSNIGYYVGSVILNSSNILEIDSDSWYRATANEFYTIPSAYQNDVLGYFYSLTYYVYFTGVMSSTGSAHNRIFRMKGRPGEGPGEQYVEQKLLEWFKAMFFVGDLSCYASASGTMEIVARSPLGNVSLPLEMLSGIRKKLIVYQPWDAEKIQEVINDPAEVAYLISYYGGGRVLSHELELRFALRGWTSLPELRQRFTLPAQISGYLASDGEKAYVIVETSYNSENELVLRAVRTEE